MFRRVFADSRRAKLIAAALLLLGLFAWAGSAARPDDARPEEPDRGTTAGKKAPGWEGFKASGPDLPVERLVIALLVIAVGAGAVIWVVRRIGGGRLGAVRPGGATRMQLLGRLPLGGRRGLVLVRAAGRLLVLGVSEAGVQKVLERDDDEAGPDDFVDALDRMRAEGER